MKNPCEDCIHHTVYDAPTIDPEYGDIVIVPIDSCDEYCSHFGETDAPYICDRFWPVKSLCNYCC